MRADPIAMIAASSSLHRRTVDRAVAFAVVVTGFAWTVLVWLEVTARAAQLHHHALLEGATPTWPAIGLFLAGWSVMLVAMMVPATLPAIRSLALETAGRHRAWSVRLGAAIAFILVWVDFGLVALAGDAVLHRIVDATPWLADRSWLIEASLFAAAGAWQFAPLKRRGLAACRRPSHRSTGDAATLRGAFAFGIDQAIACLASSWALMLLMFGEGMASLPWMVLLTSVMAYEAVGRHGPALGRVVGVVLLLASVPTVSSVPL